MSEHLGAVARQARREAGRTLRQMRTAIGISEATLSRFERGQTWSHTTDALVEGYERELGLPRRDLWARAILRARCVNRKHGEDE